jgi:hypothetical protein
MHIFPFMCLFELQTVVHNICGENAWLFMAVCGRFPVDVIFRHLHAGNHKSNKNPQSQLRFEHSTSFLNI